MDDSPNRKVEIFTEALKFAGGERAAYLDRVCGSDLKLRHQVEALLQSHGEAGDFLDEFSRSTLAGIRPGSAAGEKPGDRIGRYKLLQQIGEGGCGIVFMAEQEEPVHRRVALKIIKPGMDTKSVIARFEAERQSLAMMDHPNIAKVFDAGATESGRPYFVMELVRGIKITDYCDQNSLTTEKRLHLFVEVCHAVQHAHQKGIIHRDIKPSNILVTRTLEGEALPIVIDFGIAKATTNQKLTDKTLFTAFEMLIGTPAYMSPEQAAFTSVDVDTRTDIYSLGVLLYELLTGSTPFDTGELLKAGIDEIRRVIREEEPVRPSTCLSKMTGADLTTVANHRQSEPPKLIRSISGDLDWMVMKALEKDRTRRYETANDLARDVQRYLANETVAARPPSNLYRFQKIVIRNKLLFAGIAIIAAFLVTALVIITASLARERQSRHAAEQGTQEAQTEATKSQQITRFLEDMLQGVGPSVARGRDTTMLREILDKTVERLAKEMTNQPAVEAELRGLIGRLYLEIGTYDRAEQMHRAALVHIRAQAGPQSEQTAASLNDLGNALWKQRKLPEAEAAYDEALAIRRHLFGHNHANVATTLNSLGAVYRRQQKLPESEALTREALEMRRALFGSEHLDVAESLRNLCIILADRGKREEAEIVAREMLAMRRRLLGNEHPLVAAALADLAWVLGLGKLAEVEALESEAFGIQRKILGDEHPDVAKSIYALGERMRNRGNLSNSHAVLHAAFSIQRKLLGEDHPDALATLRGIGATLEEQGKQPEAELAYREALMRWRKQAPNEHPHVLGESEALARVLIAQKKLTEAEQVLDEALTPAVMQQPSSARLLSLRVDLLGRQGRWVEAAADATLAVEHQPKEHDYYHILAPLLVITRNRSAYDPLCDKILTTFTNTLNPYVAGRMAKDCLLWPGPAIDLRLVDKLADVAVTRGSGENSLPSFQVAKAQSHYRQTHLAEAIAWAEKALSGSQVYVQAQACAVLAAAHSRLGHPEQARAMLTKGVALAPDVAFVPSVETIGSDWLDWLVARIWLDEAAALIQSPASARTEAEKQ